MFLLGSDPAPVAGGNELGRRPAHFCPHPHPHLSPGPNYASPSPSQRETLSPGRTRRHSS